MKALLDGLIGLNSPGTIVITFVYCLLLAGAIETASRGRRPYAAVALGLAIALYARVAYGFIDPGLDTLLTAVGLVLAAALVASDLVFESNPEP